MKNKIDLFTFTILCYLERIVLSDIHLFHWPDDYCDRKKYIYIIGQPVMISEWISFMEDIFYNSLKFIYDKREIIKNCDYEALVIDYIDNVVEINKNSNYICLNFLKRKWENFKKLRTEYLVLDKVMRKEITTENGNVLSYLVSNSGYRKTIFITCAIYTSYKIWNPLIDFLYKDYRIFIYECNSSKNNIEEYADDINSITEYEKLEDFIMLSWCSGFKTGLKYLSKYPGKMRKWIIIAGNYSSLLYKNIFLSDYERNIIEIAKLLDKSKRKIKLESMFRVIMEKNAYANKVSLKSIWGIPPYLNDIVLNCFSEEQLLREYLIMYMRYMEYDYLKDIKEISDNLEIFNLYSKEDTISDSRNCFVINEFEANVDVHNIEVPLSSHWAMFENFYLYREIIYEILKV